MNPVLFMYQGSHCWEVMHSARMNGRAQPLVEEARRCLGQSAARAEQMCPKDRGQCKLLLLSHVSAAPGAL